MAIEFSPLTSPGGTLAPKCLHLSVVLQAKEKKTKTDEFLLRVAETIASKLLPSDLPAKIESVVNLTSHHLVKKMNASHANEIDFKKKLLGAVVEVESSVLRLFSLQEYLFRKHPGRTYYKDIIQ